MKFEQGEIRSIGIEVINKTGSQFIIDTAECIISCKSDVVERSNCTIDGHKLLTLFHADAIGIYKATFIYTIAEERLIDEFVIEVR